MKGCQQALWPENASRKPFSFRELPVAYRPEIRARIQGPQALSDVELVVLLIGEAKKESAQDVAGRVLALGNRLDRAGVEELTPVVGSRRKATRLVAALELGRRIAGRPAEARAIVKAPEHAVHIVEPQLRGLDREQFVAMLLGTKNQLLALKTVSIGTVNSSPVHPRELFKAAVTHSAAAVILVHNHPSGDPAPSLQDIELTKQLMKAGELMGIQILDHIVVGDGRWVSFKTEGLI